jgi:hypothetical protein
VLHTLSQLVSYLVYGQVLAEQQDTLRLFHMQGWDSKFRGKRAEHLHGTWWRVLGSSRAIWAVEGGWIIARGGIERSGGSLRDLPATMRATALPVFKSLIIMADKSCCTICCPLSDISTGSTALYISFQFTLSSHAELLLLPVEFNCACRWNVVSYGYAIRNGLIGWMTDRMSGWLTDWLSG